MEEAKGSTETIRGKVHYIQIDADEFEEEFDRIVSAIGDKHVVRAIGTPCTYIHAVDEELRGITITVDPDTPVNRSLLRPTLCTGTSEYALTVLEDGKSKITRKALRDCTAAFNACVSEAITDRDSCFDVLSEKAHDWEPCLGRDCVDAIRTARYKDLAQKRYHWRLFVTSGLDYAAEKLIQYAIEQEWTISKFYHSVEYQRLMRAASFNRNRIAYAATLSLNLQLTAHKYEAAMTASKVDYLVPIASSLHNTIIKKDLGESGGGVLYSVHIDTYPLSAYHRIPFMRTDTQLVKVFEPDGNAGKRSWRNHYADSFPSSCGMKNYSELRRMMTNWEAKEAYGNEHCDKRWESVVPYNLWSIDDSNKSFTSIEMGLRDMGLAGQWKQTDMEVVMLKIASMKEEHLTAFELLKTTASKQGKVLVPIRSNVFRGGDGYKGLWHVYTMQDPPPASILADYPVPGYVAIEKKYLIRIARANEEITDVYHEFEEGADSDSAEGESTSEEYSSDSGDDENIELDY